MRDKNVYANNHKYGGGVTRSMFCYVKYNSSNRMRMWYFAPRSRSQPSEIWRPEWKPLCCIWIMSPQALHLNTYTHLHIVTQKDKQRVTHLQTLWCIWVMSQRAVEAPFTRLAVPPRDHYHNNFHTTPHLRPVDATLQSLSTTMTLPNEIGRLLWVDDFQLMAELTWRSVK